MLKQFFPSCPCPDLPFDFCLQSLYPKAKRQMMFAMFRYLFLALVIASPLSAQQEPGWQEELNQINGDIEKLQSQLHEYRRKALSDEMQAQPQMFDNFHEYAQDIQANEADEDMVIKIKAHLRELQARKQKLMQAHPQ
jgi:hypothetical protein